MGKYRFLWKFLFFGSFLALSITGSVKLVPHLQSDFYRIQYSITNSAGSILTNGGTVIDVYLYEGFDLAPELGLTGELRPKDGSLILFLMQPDTPTLQRTAVVGEWKQSSLWGSSGKYIHYELSREFPKTYIVNWVFAGLFLFLYLECDTIGDGLIKEWNDFENPDRKSE